jgi:23S rRNA (cytidine1920-2'-O)/16S rRNA (cytidine1409-2'-O)-methyltransferase
MASPPKKRLDLLLQERGLAQSRERARALVLAGHVEVAGTPVTKAGALVSQTAEIRLRQPDLPYVSRGGVKLAAALKTLGVDPRGRLCLDVGASTGGFTDVLLRHGARKVYAVDVGYGQLAWSLRQDPRVVVLERQNARALTARLIPEPVELAVVDVSFISLALVLPAIRPLLATGGQVLALVKPQFEAGRGATVRGVVRDPAVREAAIARVRGVFREVGLDLCGETPSALPGPKGNQEHFLLGRAGDRSVGPGGS